MRSDRLGTHEALRVDRSWADRHDNDRTSATSLVRVTAARERLARIERLSKSELSIVREEIEKDGE
jgi:hypothetical protein